MRATILVSTFLIMTTNVQAMMYCEYNDPDCFPKECKITSESFESIRPRHYTLFMVRQAFDCGGTLVSQSGSFGDRSEIYRFIDKERKVGVVIMTRGGRRSVTDTYQIGLD